MGTYADKIVALAPVGYWKFGEALNTDNAVNEIEPTESGTYAVGQVVAETSLIESETGTCAKFNGSSDYVSITDNTGALTLTGDLSITIVFKPYALPEVTAYRYTLAEFGNSLTSADSHNSLYKLAINKYGTIFYTHEFGVNQEIIELEFYPATTIVIGNTYHLILTRNATTGDVYVTLDADADETDYYDLAEAPVGGASGHFEVGKSASGSQQYFNGWIDDLAVFDRVLNSTEKSELFSSMSSIRTFNPPNAVIAYNSSAPNVFISEVFEFTPPPIVISLSSGIPKVDVGKFFDVDETLTIVEDITLLKPLADIVEIMNVDDIVSLRYFIVFSVVERLTAHDILSGGLSFNESINEIVSAIDNAWFISEQTVDESVSINDSALFVHNAILGAIETINIVDSYDGKLHANAHVTELLSIFDDAVQQHIIVVSDELSAIDTVDFIITVVKSISESVTISGTTTPILRAVTIIDELIEISDTSSNGINFLVNVSESIGTFGEIIIDDEHYTMVINSRTKGISEYLNYNFNSMSDGLAANSNGIYRLTGSSDDGVNIDASILTGLIDFESSKEKKVPYAYIGMNKSGRILFKTITNYRGNKQSVWYEINPRDVGSTDTVKLKLGRGVKSRYWQFSISNIDGSEFDIDDLELMPVELKRKF